MYPEWTERVWKEAYNNAIECGASKWEAEEYAREQQDMAAAKQMNAGDWYPEEEY